MGNKEPLISVIIPVYNGEKYLAGCVENIQGQTYRHLEIIIVNDGSTDGTAQICASLQKRYEKGYEEEYEKKYQKECQKEYHKKYNHIKVITLKDEGVSAARNAGIEAASGEFITFVDADDRLRPDMLQMLYDCIQTVGSDVAGCRFFIWGNEEDWQKALEKKEPLPSELVRLYTPASYVEEAVLQGNSRCWSKLYRREAIGGARFRTGLSIGEDMLFLLDMLSSVKKIAEMPYQGYGYFQNPGGAIAREFTPQYMDQIHCWELARDIIAKQDEKSRLYRKVTALLMMGIMLTAGKLAMLPVSRRRTQKEYIRICHNKLKESMRVPGAYRELSVGYQIKTVLFRYLPGLYLTLYHWKKA